ncbi:hypothetical protein [Arthrobacter sp. MMS18-M83]|uniref:hypothetical protein n=1 Tax=Arthrobacter sp. MMS18-M83 TaxID=2996261 RepID=UPI00227BB898|nr:hypothetical protein [Arthrobacter sp. MMS18-M83]WAH95403.1 hypothetical protein OW521_13135 [Arthrobacter sp. MMS18-M83]
MANRPRGRWDSTTQTAPPITVEVPVLGIGSGPSAYEELGSYVWALRRPRGLHMTLLHLGVVEDFCTDVAVWTKGNTSPESAMGRTVSWLERLPVLEAFSGSAERLIVLGAGGVAGLEIDLPASVHEFQVSLVHALHELLDELLVDNIDDFILSSPALGFRSPRWVPHVAVGRPKYHGRGPWEIARVGVDFGESRIRNRQFLPQLP